MRLHPPCNHTEGAAGAAAAGSGACAASGAAAAAAGAAAPTAAAAMVLLSVLLLLLLPDRRLHEVIRADWESSTGAGLKQHHTITQTKNRAKPPSTNESNSEFTTQHRKAKVAIIGKRSLAVGTPFNYKAHPLSVHLHLQYTANSRIWQSFTNSSHICTSISHSNQWRADCCLGSNRILSKHGTPIWPNHNINRDGTPYGRPTI